MRAVRLVVNYYTYFLNLDTIKGAYVEEKGIYTPSQWTYDAEGNPHWTPGQWTGYHPTIHIRKYKTKIRQEESNKLKTLITLSPDMHCEIDTTSSNRGWDVYNVTWVNPELPSIANNSLGLERNNVSK